MLGVEEIVGETMVALVSELVEKKKGRLVGLGFDVPNRFGGIFGYFWGGKSIDHFVDMEGNFGAVFDPTVVFNFLVLLLF